MFDLSIDNLFNPILLFWISFFYLVILFHSFGITKIWNRINGVELLFLSAVVGYIYYIASIYLIFPLISLIKSLIDLFPIMIPSSLSLLNLQINYSDFAKFFVYLSVTILTPVISYFIVIFPIYLIIKAIQYCLDPNQEIFPNYKRFIFLKNIQFSEVIVFNIPTFLFIISLICLSLGGLINTTQNIFFSYDIWILINSFLQIVTFFLSLFIIYFFLLMLKESGKNISNLLIRVISEFFKYLDKQPVNDEFIKNRLFIFIQKHLRGILLFVVFCIFLLMLNEIKQGITFSKLFFWILLIFLGLEVVFLQEKWIDVIFKELEFGSRRQSDRPLKKISDKEIDYGLIDAPLDDPKDDQFLRSNFTSGIVHTIKSRTDPSCFVISIYGKWGEGKTTTLNFIEKALKENNDIICVRYNPWRYNDENQLLQNFFFTLADSLGRSLSSNKERLGELFIKYATILTPFSINFDGFVDISPGEILLNAGKAFSSVELEDVKKRIEKILDEEGKKVIIFIDDIDRLDRQEIQMILKIVKLSADFRHTIYLLALDEEMVASALSEKYGTGETGTNENGKKFLEKIIQVPLHLPVINSTVLANICFKGIEDILKKEAILFSEEDKQQFSYQFTQGFVPNLRTPRLVKRYINALAFSLPLMKNKINNSDLLLLEAIRIIYPSSFQVLRTDPDAFIASDLNIAVNKDDIKGRYLNTVNSALNLPTEFEKANLRTVLIFLFPRIKTLYENTFYGPDWDLKWDEQKRASSKRHLDRYFAYTFPKGDISEQEVSDFIDFFNQLTDNQVFERLQEFTSTIHTADLFIIEIRKKLNSIPSEIRTAFVIALSKNSFLFPDFKYGLKLSPFSQLAIFCREFLLIIPEDEKISLSKSICRNSQPVTFGFEFLRWIKSFSRRDPDNKIINDSDFKDLAEILINRIKEISTTDIFYLDYPEFTPEIFYYWSIYGLKNDIEPFLFKSFEQGPDNVIAFLKCYLTKAWSADGPVRGNLPRDAYDSIVNFCEPSIIFNALEKKFGKLPSDNYPIGEDIDLDRQIAFQFSYLYHHKDRSDYYFNPKKINEEEPKTTEVIKEDEPLNSKSDDKEKEEKIVKHLGKTIFSPIKFQLETDRDFLNRGYTIERYFQDQDPRSEKYIKQTPKDFLKKIIYEPDSVLKKYFDRIKQMSEEYDEYEKRLEGLNQKIFYYKDSIWPDFVALCNRLNRDEKLPNDSDYLSVFSLAFANCRVPQLMSVLLTEFMSA